MNTNLRILELCKAKGLTQAALAEKVGISRVGLSKALNGNTTIGTLEKVAAALGVEVVELFAPVSNFWAVVEMDGKLQKFTNIQDLRDYLNTLPV